MKIKKSKKIGVYIDTNIFVSYARKKEKQLHKSSKEFIDYIINNMKFEEFNTKFDFFTSRFTEAEIASALRRQKHKENEVRGFLHKMSSPDWARAIIPLPKSMGIQKFVPEVVEAAIKYGAKFADSVQACCIQLHRESINYIITNDGPLKTIFEKKLKKVKILTIKEGLPLLKKLRN